MFVVAVVVAGTQGVLAFVLPFNRFWRASESYENRFQLP